VITAPVSRPFTSPQQAYALLASDRMIAPKTPKELERVHPSLYHELVFEPSKQGSEEPPKPQNHRLTVGIDANRYPGGSHGTVHVTKDPGKGVMLNLKATSGNGVEPPQAWIETATPLALDKPIWLPTGSSLVIGSRDGDSVYRIANPIQPVDFVPAGVFSDEQAANAALTKMTTPPTGQKKLSKETSLVVERQEPQDDVTQKGDNQVIINAQEHPGTLGAQAEIRFMPETWGHHQSSLMVVRPDVPKGSPEPEAWIATPLSAVRRTIWEPHQKLIVGDLKTNPFVIDYPRASMLANNS
jgi:hypothetical protein